MTVHEKILKQQLKIVSTLILLLTINISFASETENKPSKAQDQEQTLQTGQKGEIQEQQLEDNTKTYEVETEEPIEPIESDSVEDDSVSKYNFIFYFLYKFKYEAEA